MRHLAIALFALGLLGCRATEPAAPDIAIDQVRADLEVIARARVFFGHQSVGRDLVKGIRALSEEAGVPLRIVSTSEGNIAGNGLVHARVGQNRAPETKLAAFMAGAADPAQPFDLAVLKFCYVDLSDESKEKSPDRLFGQYMRDMSRLQSEQPELKVLHVTMPLMSDPPGWKTTLKRWLGWSTYRDDAHSRRAAYNEQVRANFNADQLFDIARLEATLPHGEYSSFSVDGKNIETMAMEYTHDGGHLNEEANRRIAAAFLHKVAAALSKRSDG